MTEPEQPEATEPEWRRQRRLAAAFGDVLPESTADDRDDPREGGRGGHEDWLKSQVPPHHG